MHARVEIFKDRAGGHRWRLRSANGEIVASATQGHRDIGDAVRGFGDARVTANAAADNPVVIAVDEPDEAPATEPAEPDSTDA